MSRAPLEAAVELALEEHLQAITPISEPFDFTAEQIEDLAEEVLARIPDGWAKLDGRW